MPKKVFNYKKIGNDIWYTDSLKGWFIVKEKDLYILRKGCIVDGTVEFGIKRYNTYKRLGDSKTGLENLLKEKTKTIINQQALFNKLKAEYESANNSLNYEELDKQAERLKEKWGLK